MTRLIHVLKNLLRHLFLNFVGMAEGFPREGCREAPHSLALCPLPFLWGWASISTAFPHLPSPLPNTTRGTDHPSLMHSSLVRLFHPGFEGPPAFSQHMLMSVHSGASWNTEPRDPGAHFLRF